MLGQRARVCLIVMRAARAAPRAAVRRKSMTLARADARRQARKAIEFFFVDNAKILLQSRFAGRLRRRKAANR